MNPATAVSIEKDYVFETAIGRGAFGEVFRGIERATGRPVAIKRMHATVTDSVSVERFDREARMLAGVDSPYVVRYHAHGVDRDGRPCLVLDWLDGMDLGALQRSRPLPLETALEIARQAALGLDAVHRAGIVHRDVKPSNFFVTGDAAGAPQVKLLDLGIARTLDDVALTLDGVRLGTPSYMSPEQARGETSLEPSSDVFSLGVVLYELFSGRRPFAGSDPFAVLARIVLEDPPRLLRIVAGIPIEVDALVARAMSKIPGERFASAKAMADVIASAPTHGDAAIVRSDDAPTTQLRSAMRLTQPERRVVTALFAGFSGTSDSARALGDFEALATTHGGVAHRTLGRRAIALFGAERSTGDESVRAARAALSVRAAWPGVRMAIATGRAVMGNAALSGEALERGTRRIEPTADGIVVDAPTARLLGSEFIVDGVGTEHDDRWVLRGVRAVNTENRTMFMGREVPLVGRERELEVLGDALGHALRDGSARALIVRSAAGLGKSRLCHELLRVARKAHGVGSPLVLYGDPSVGDVPLAVLSRVLRQEAGVDDGRPTEERQTAVRKWARQLGLSDQAAMVGELLRVDFDVANEPGLAAARADPGVLRARLRETLALVLRARSRDGSVLIALDDAQWIDRPTLDTLAWLVDLWADRALLVAAFSRGEKGDDLDSAFSSTGPTVVALEPLTERASESLVRAIVGSECDDGTVRAIVQRAMGYPLFIEELVRARSEGGADELPLAVQAAFQVRLDRLAPATKHLVRLATVFGMSVWHEALRVLAPDLDVDAALAALVTSEILAERPRSRFASTREYTFRHALLHDAAYATLLPEELAGLHRQAGEWLAQAGERDAAVLARHFERGGEISRAVENYRDAARRAADESAFELASAHAARGLSLGGDAETRVELHVIAARCDHPLGRYASVQEHCRAALELSPSIAKRLEIAAILGLVLRRTGYLRESSNVLLAAYEIELDANASPRARKARMEVGVELAWNDYAAWHFGSAIERANGILQNLPAEVFGLDSLVLSTFHVLGRAQHGEGLLEAALASHRLTVARATSQSHRWRGEGARVGLGQVLLALGQNDEARAELTLAERNARTLRLRSSQGYASLYLGVAHLRFADPTAALASARLAADIGHELAAPALEAGGRALEAMICARANDGTEAERAADAACAIAGCTADWRAVAEAARALGAASAGRRDEAFEWIGAAHAHLEAAAGGDDVDALVEAALLDAYAALGASDRASALLARARGRLGRILARVRSEPLRRSISEGIPEHRRLLGT